MNNLLGKYILIIIPKSQFCEEELNGVRTSLQQSGAKVIVLSKSGQEARGLNKKKFQPDGMIVDWNKKIAVNKKYHAVILLGGKGAKKSLWDDPIIPQILTDHYRFGSIIGAIGEALVVLVRASLVTGEIPLPQDEDTCQELKSLNAVCIDTSVISYGNMVYGQSRDSIEKFSEIIIGLVETSEVI